MELSEIAENTAAFNPETLYTMGVYTLHGPSSHLAHIEDRAAALDLIRDAANRSNTLACFYMVMLAPHDDVTSCYLEVINSRIAALSCSKNATKPVVEYGVPLPAGRPKKKNALFAEYSEIIKTMKVGGSILIPAGKFPGYKTLNRKEERTQSRSVGRTGVMSTYLSRWKAQTGNTGWNFACRLQESGDVRVWRLL